MNAAPFSIEVHKLEKRFGNFRAVKAIDLVVRRGEIFGFIGANGAGKTTTIKMLCGLLPPDGGKANVAGIDVAADPEGVKRRIGYMCQKFALYGDLTAAENIDFFGGIYGLPTDRLEKRRTEIFDLLELSAHADRFAADLPRGYQQRLALACAVVHEPAVIFLDEPTAGVDPIQRRAFWDLIYSFSAAGTTVFVTTHFLDEAEYCHRVAFIADGELAAEDTPAGLKGLLADWTIYELRAADPAGLLPAVRALPDIRSAALFGETLHVTAGAAADPKTVFGGLAGLAGYTPIPPTLEDVFLHITGKKS
ncbi:MAG: ABC transporter ATP-binding protein [Candidatus Aminicenantes bacterium]|nr:ABC transporter ATP-binding protein [Candidatus Aminicenantes bacterium]